MEDLKKCPFCGGEAGLSVKRGFKGEVVVAFVYCTECGANTRGYALESTAREAWSRRVKE